MAEASVPLSPPERYSAIEAAYRQEQWSRVMQQGEALLDHLAGQSDPGSVGVRQRVQLLLGHTYLHGLGDRDSAEDQYSALLQGRTEPLLRQAAEEGLRACNRPRQARPAPTLTTPEPQGRPDQLPPAEPGPAPTAARSAARGSEESGLDTTSLLTPGPGAPASLVPAAAPATGANGGAAVPVTAAAPWLSALTPEEPLSADRRLATEPRGEDNPSTSSLPGTSSAAAPWLAAPPLGVSTQEPLAPHPHPDPLASLEASSRQEPGGDTALPPLVVDVVEEPELLEVHQADPRWAEELVLQELPPPKETQTPAPDPADPELVRGLLRVRLY